MWNSAITAYLHYLSFMLAFGALAVEHQTLKKDLSVEEAWKIVAADAIYGLSAVTVLVTGILRVLYFGKGPDYYLSSPTLYIKVGLFFLVGFLSLYPTVSFLFWIKSLRNNQPPSLGLPQFHLLSWLIRGELIGLSLIPLFASMMARGIQIF